MITATMSEKNNCIDFFWKKAQYSDVFNSFENFMGRRSDDKSLFSYAHIMKNDEQEQFPQASCDALNQWGLHKYYVTKKMGGELASFEVTFGLLRLLSRRDLTIAIAHGKTYLGASAVWVAGNNTQKEYISQLILAGGVISLALTEKQHGSDLAANEVTAQFNGSHYLLNGEKWLINNATRSQALTLFSRTANTNSSRNHSLFIVAKDILDAKTYSALPKIKTTGIRGADISGIKFNNAVLPENSLVGEEGSGLEIILKSLQISRTMCASLSLGAADTALRTTLNFVVKRRLYSISLDQIKYIRQMLVNAFLEIITCECLAITAVRCLNVAPELMSLYSSIVKYIIPTKTEKLFASLANVLGARFYLREIHDQGIFQKFMRDNRLVSLFDGSTIVNLQNIANQIGFVAKKYLKNVAIKSNDKLAHIFTLHKSVPLLSEQQLKLSVHGEDIFINSLTNLREKISTDRLIELRQKQEIISLLDHNITDVRELFVKIVTKNTINEKIDQDKEKTINAYCNHVIAACALNLWYHNKNKQDVFFKDPVWLISCLERLLDPKKILDDNKLDKLWQRLFVLYQQKKLFSLTPVIIND